MKLASRLSALYAALLGVTVLIVVLSSSLALVFELWSFSGDILIAKHEQARILVDQMRREGLTLNQSAPDIVRALTGIGLNVAVFDTKGRFIAGDKDLHPRALDRVVRVGGMSHFLPPTARSHDDTARPLHPGFPPGVGPPDLPDTRLEPLTLAAVDGGYIAFGPSFPLIFVSLVPYWRLVLAIAIVGMVLSWLVGRGFAAQLLRPINEVSDSLRALARGDYTQRRFVMAGGDEVADLTAAYNEAAASVATAMEERRRGEDRMRQFAADAGHELRTPLTVIGGYIDVLRRGAIEEPQIARQILATMSLEKEHMRGLIDRLMRLARLDSEELPRPEKIELAEFLRMQCDAARRLDDSRVIDYRVEGVESIQADRSELGEAVWNIIENALKYAPDAPIHVSAARNNGHVVLAVRDEGPGMSESERLHAFERFYRGDQRGEIAGSGLGLAIAKRAVQRAGGDISIDSAPGHGTEVTITLPS
ncbi:MAG TPA: HAMP domain-containing sensor histidine kinase [Candidatus Baltobacteraceae bacterium]|nr:HAMP domain-containing sensor histidine kinase [Candidatus Baltobacteraceae bacterium]